MTNTGLDQHIQDIVKRLNKLKIEQTSLLTELTTRTIQSAPKKEKKSSRTPKLKVGDKVEFFNTYRGERRVTGAIIAIRPNTATVETTNGTQTKWLANLRQIS